MGELRQHAGLWREFVPVAWHVNYWDRLGWPDKFADQTYTERQYAYAEHWQARSVYTPGLVRGGDEWRIKDGRMTAAGSSVGGELEVEVLGDRLVVSYTGLARVTDELQVNVVRLGGGIASNVRSGENKGRKLQHEFLVLGWGQEPLLPGPTEIDLPPADPDVNPTREAIAVWISRVGDPTPLQATGGWLD